ncbi:transferase family protein [Kitasatospora sp. SolWspMP-SS2h]|uniref:acyltransferase n=1 Tax=Kitasatospora sp. SolWspMP-SS2h TaxID=1305729 RepID=UPI000DBF6966|nr:acyltransferase [Kitasatospora sp. SolWspMP-SS2h]RAJ42713.1 transferase family protein [Kitasatospora sp. SolWspMP-SS2h]
MTGTLTSDTEIRTVRAGGPGPGPVRCSVGDLLLADLPVSVVFFHDRPLDPDALADGLARALGHLPEFAGRLRTDGGGGLWIDPDDSGVPFTVADAPYTLTEALDRMALPANGLVDHVRAGRARREPLPLLTVRLNRLADGAAALGVSWHHAVGDMQTFALLMRTWSACTEGTALPEVLRAADRDLQLDAHLPAEDCGTPALRLPDPAEAAELRRAVAGASLANRTVQVWFSPAETDRLRTAYSTGAGRRLSANDALCAHLLHVLRELDGAGDEEQTLTMPVNLRRVLGLPDGTLGNLLGEIRLPYRPGTEPARYAAELRTAVEEFTEKHLSVRSNLRFLDTIGRDRVTDCVPAGFDPARRTLTISSWCRLGLQDLPLAGHRPIAFSPAATLQLPWTSWLVEGPRGEGHLYTLVLPTRTAARLRTATALLHPHRHPDDPAPAVAPRRLL